MCGYEEDDTGLVGCLDGRSGRGGGADMGRFDFVRELNIDVVLVMLGLYHHMGA